MCLNLLKQEKKLRSIHVLLISALLLSTVGCGKKEKPYKVQKVPVELSTVTTADIPFIVKGIGQLAASVEVDVRAQSTGILKQILFEDGQLVEEGDLLFVIEQDMYQAQLESAKAQLIEAEAQYRYAVDFAETYGALVGEEFVSRLQYEQGVSNVGLYNGQIKAALAAIKQAEINLGYTEIRAPTKGYIAKHQFDEGNFIEAGGGQILTTIRKVVPIDVMFSIPSSYVEELRIQQREQPLVFECVRSGLNADPLFGTVYYIDNIVNENTGMIMIKGTIPNIDERGWPGEFVRVYLKLKTLKNITVIPQGAVIPGQNVNHVFIAKEGENGELTAEVRAVETGFSFEGVTIVEWGLNPGEQVVTDGHGQLYPGAPMFVPKPKSEETKAA